MYSFTLVGLLGLAAVANAQDSTTSYTVSSSNSSIASSTSSLTTSSLASSTSSGPATAITVATDGSGQFTQIGAAVTAAQNSKIATVTVLAGTYSEYVYVGGSQTVTIVGETASPTNDWTNNKVTVYAPAAATPAFSVMQGTNGLTVKNMNFINANTGNAAVAKPQGKNVAFYGCSFVSSGAIPIQMSYGYALIANSYIEGTTQLFYNYPTLYVYNSTLVPTAGSALVVYNKGNTISGTFYNSTVVVDSSTIAQKSGLSNKNVFLAAPNAGGSQAIFRNTSMGSFMAAQGTNQGSAFSPVYYGEFETTGAGSYSQNAASRVYDALLTADQVSAFTIDKVFANGFSTYVTTDLSWVDQDILTAIKSSDAAQVSAYSASATVVSSTSSAVPISSAAVSTSSAVIASGNSIVQASTSTVASSTTSTSAASTCSAAAASGTYTVSKNPGPCEYSNITAAINALPNDKQAKTIVVGAGVYNEQLSVTRLGKVTLIGATNYTNDYTQNTVKVEFSYGVLTSAGQDELTPVINSKKTNDNSGLALYNIDFVNTYPQTKNTAALAADFYGANMAFYGCSFTGFQDTLLANKGTQVFSNCYIEGSVDFIWGYSTAYFHQCKIASNTAGACNTAQSRPTNTSTGGYVFDSCYVTYTSTYGSTMGQTYLGRPYSQYAIVVYMNSYLDQNINSAGWQVWSTSSPQTSGVLFGEFNNSGPGSWQAGTARASFATNLTATQAASYTLASWIGDTTWLDMTAYNYIPSYPLTGASTTTSSSGSSTSASSTSSNTATASINAHPESGSVPPVGAVVVSVDGSHNASFTNLTAALTSLPNDSTNQTIFLYAGTYNEQVPSINRPGAVRIIGYITGNPGQKYSDNQVTISYSRGLSVSPLPTGHSDAETAVVSTASNRISFYNLNIVNTDNLDGLEASYVTLATSLYGNDIAFYACSFNGWQDTMLNGATAGYQYFESCYIGGAIDFIWGYSKAYFKGCTIGAKRKSSAVTAQSRASLSAIGGYVFDQCLFTKAPDATVDLDGVVYLGRPYSQYALVNIKNSYIDSVIAPAGWKVWSATDPRTDHITFTEFNNSGPSNWENNAAARLAFGNATLLTSDEYHLSSVMDNTEWIDMTYWNSIVTPQPATTSTTPTANITVSGNSTYDGTSPPSGALVVSKNAIEGITTYDTIQGALNAAPTSSKTNATIFIYPGVYEEQLVLNKSGYTIFMGYSNATDDYSLNQVTIQSSYGVDTQADESDSDSATVYATGNYFLAYNVNFRNVNGTTKNIASLGFAVKSSKYAALYGCQVYGNQDTLLVNGYFFAFKSYIEGNVDFIWGSGAGYFLNSTIAANEDDINITADKRATNTTAGGFVFDQCSIVPAAGNTGFNGVGLGRPWNDLARVAYVDCYLDSMIEAAGWNQWSKSTPQTDAVTFVEYHNYGPGSSVCGRANFSSQLDDSTPEFFTTTSWIDFSHVDVNPFTPGIGSAPAACASSTVSSSTVSATKTSSTLSSVSYSSVPLVTVYTTKTVTASSTAVVSVTSADVTSTTIVKATDYETAQGSDVISTTVQKVTSTITYSSPDVISTSVVKLASTVSYQAPDTTSTSVILITEDVGSTVTPEPKTKSAVVRATTTVSGVTTVAASTTTIKGTTTVIVQKTTSLKPITSTENQGSTVIVTGLITPKAVSVSSTTTISVAPSKTKTVSIVGSTEIVSVVSVKTTTRKATTTLSCITTNAARMVRRGAVIPRAAGTTTVAATTTITAIVKTSTVAQAGSTAYVTSTSFVKTVYSTIPGSTSVATATSVVKTASVGIAGTTSIATITSYTKTSTVTIPGSTVYATVTSTTAIGKTTTLKAGTTTVGSTSYATVTAYSTVSQDAVTISSLKTVSATQVVTAPQSTITVTNAVDVTSTVLSTLATPTSTIYKTITQDGGTATVSVTAAAMTKTTTIKSSVTVTSYATKTAKNAAACTA
ncbi:hypothetical protein H2203_005039 [Taxawa tesnikishii (nom. ined.)]|nr:hypothetical protein H2203_005039 [Dothideales sp. JES 119]